MYLVGHIAVAFLLNFVIKQFVEVDIAYRKIVVGFAAMIPDIIDKPIGGLIFSQGRWYGHSLLVLTTVFLVVMLVIQNPFKKPRHTDLQKYIIFLYGGSIVHVFADLPSIQAVTMFWPLFGPLPSGTKGGFLMGFTSTITIVQELLGLLVIISIGWYEKWSRINWLVLLAVLLAYAALFILLFTIIVGW